MRYEPLRVAAEFERHLGDPRDPKTLFSYQRCAGLDSAEEFPVAICAFLDEWGLPGWYVPEEHGGDLARYDAVLQLIRAVARRDLTAAIAHGKTFLGSVSAWVAGGPPARGLADLVRAGAPVSWGLTERGHGSDLMAGEVMATPVRGGYRIDGEKWLINNATQGRLVSVLARSDPAGGPRGYDVFVVNKEALPPGAYQCLPKVHTHGIRGADISGIAFDGAVIPAEARLGDSGSGLNIVLKGLQLTRTMCSALSLGASEHAVRSALNHLGGRPDEWCLRLLVDAYADHLLTELVAIVGARSVHALPEELSMNAAVVKYLLPQRTDNAIRSMQGVFGLRSAFVDGSASGRFEKLMRDHRIVSLFDGNSVVNLSGIIGAMPVVARNWQSVRDEAAVHEVFDLSEPLRHFRPDRLALTSRRGSSLLAGLPEEVAALHRLDADRPGLAAAARNSATLLRQAEGVVDEITSRRLAGSQPPEADFELARRLALCVAGSAAIRFFLRNEANDLGPAEPLWRDGVWLAAVLARVLTDLGEPPAPDAHIDRRMLDALLDQWRTGRALSLLSYEVAEGVSDEHGDRATA